MGHVVFIRSYFSEKLLNNENENLSQKIDLPH